MYIINYMLYLHQIATKYHQYFVTIYYIQNSPFFITV